MAPRKGQKTQKRQNNKNRSTRKNGGENILSSLFRNIGLNSTINIRSNSMINDKIAEDFKNEKEREQKKINDKKTILIKEIKNSDKTFFQKRKAIAKLDDDAAKLQDETFKKLAKKYREKTLPYETRPFLVKKY